MKKLFLRLRYHVAVGGAIGLLLCIEPAAASPDSFLSVQETVQTVAVRNVTLQDDVRSGEIVNMSPRQLRDVQLLIRQMWQWKNEFRPGPDAPGTAAYYTVGEEILPGETVRFTYRLPSMLAPRSDGYFETSVSVAGFTEIYQPTEAQIRDEGRKPVS